MNTFSRWLGDRLVLILGLLVLLYMFVPIFVVILMSFNAAGRAQQLHLQRLHARQLAQHLRALPALLLAAHQHRDRAPGHARSRRCSAR